MPSLSQNSYDVLKFFRERKNFVKDDDLPESISAERINTICRKGLLERRIGNDAPYFAYKITSDGLDALYQFEQECNDKAKAEADKRFDHKMSILNVVLPFLTFVIGLLVQYGTNIIGFITELFH